MAEMLRTWKHGGVGGVELFGPDVRHQIEAEIFATRVDPARERVVISLADALRSKRAALARNPEDAEARVHVGVLEQVRLLSTKVVLIFHIANVRQSVIERSFA